MKQQAAFRRSAAGQRERDRSVHTYRKQSSSEALATLKTHYRPWLDTPVLNAVAGANGAPVRFISDHSMSIDGPGNDDALVTSTGFPLRDRDETGALRPVDLRLISDDGRFEPANPLAETSFPARLRDGISLGTSGIRLAADSGAAAANGKVVNDRVFYGGAADTDVILNATPGGFELSLQLRSPDAARVHPLRFELPAGARLRVLRNGAADIVRGTRRLALVHRAWAVDAQGAEVPVRYTARGDSLLLRVSHSAGKTAYPVFVDPVVDDYSGDTNSDWHSNPTASTVPWACQLAPPMVCADQGQWGHGLYVVMPAGAYAPSASWWNYQLTGGADAYISQVDFLYNVMGGDFQGADVQQGIWSTRTGSWQASASGAPYWNAPYDRTVTTGSTAGDRATHGLVMPNTASKSGMGVLYLGGARIYANDRVPPTVSNVTHGQNNAMWWGSGQTLSSNVTGSSTGLGVRSLRVAGAGTDQTKTAPCDGTHQGGYCSPTFSQPFTFATNSLTEGIGTLSATSKSPSGSTSSATSWTVKVDKTAPTLSISGDGWETPSGTITPGTRSVTVAASDDKSGISRIEFKIGTGAGVGGTQTHTQVCSTAGCPTNVTRTFTYDPANFPAGPQVITVTARDGANPVSAANTRTENKAVTFVNDHVFGPVSVECDASAKTVADGWTAGTYARVQVQQSGAQTLVCYQINNGTSIRKSGVFQVQAGNPAAGIPSDDPNHGACTDAGSAPFYEADIAGQHVMLASHTTQDAAWVCIQAGSVARRVIVPLPNGSDVRVVPTEDIPAKSAPGPEAWTPGPSATCAAGGTQLVNSDYGPAHVWLAEYRPDASTAYLCVREEGLGVNIGGALRVSATGGVDLPLKESTDLTPCTLPLYNQTAPFQLAVTVSQPGASQPSVCVRANDGLGHSIATRYYIQPGGSGVSVTWTPDAGTPGGPVGI